MWTNLTDPRLIQFFEHLGPESRELAGRMTEAVKVLQTHPVADRLFAFTSHYHLQVTTAPDIYHDTGHSLIGIIWDYSRQQYRVHVGAIECGWAFDPDDQTCVSAEGFPAVVDCLIRQISAPK